LFEKMFEPDTDYAQLDYEEKATVGFYFRAVVERFASQHALYEAGILTSDAWGELSQFCAGFVSAPAFTDLWKAEQEQPIYPKSFLDHMRSTSATRHVTGVIRHE